ncbi:hypothetical protein TMatcc_008077 [Talaromyces marneffei ATCC 18224]
MSRGSKKLRCRTLNPSVYANVSYFLVDPPFSVMGKISNVHNIFATAMNNEFRARPAPGQIRRPQPNELCPSRDGCGSPFSSGVESTYSLGR